MTELMQAHRQWMSRAPDERFTSLLDMQEFKQRNRNASNSSVLSSRALTVLSIEDDARGLRVTARTEDSALIPTHWSFGQLCSLASPGNSPATGSVTLSTTAPVENVALGASGSFSDANGIDAELLPHPPQSLPYRTSEPEGFVLSVNRLDRAKRNELLLEALAAEPRLQCVIVGDGPDRARLEDLSRRHGLDGAGHG